MKQQNTSLLIGIRILMISWLCCKLIGWKMWTMNRSFPVIHPFSWMEKIPAPIHIIFLFTGALILIKIVLLPKDERWWIALVIVEILSSSLDYNRWQPWNFQFISLTIVWYTFRRQWNTLIWLTTIIFASTYVYSGISKLNPLFIQHIWKSIMLHEVLGIEFNEMTILLKRAGWIIPFIEIFSGLGLLFNPFRKRSSLTLIGMHLLLVTIMGNWFFHHNRIIIPWNIGSLLLIYFLLYKNHLQKPEILSSPKKIIASFVILFWALLPSLNRFEMWDTYFSMKLYSGNTPHLYICTKKENIPQEILKSLPLLKISKKACKGQWQFSIQKWAVHETHVPSYPEKRVYDKIIIKLNKEYPEWKFETVYRND
jgi:hypothetical protein